MSRKTGYMDVVKRILRYLKGTVGDRLTYVQSSCGTPKHDILTYTDADWAGDPDERRFVSGYCVFIGRESSLMEQQETEGYSTI